MGEFTEFAEALLDQIAVEINEEEEIAKLSEKISEDSEFPNQFTELESFSKDIFTDISKRIEDFTGYTVKPDLRIEFPELKEFKLLKKIINFSFDSEGFPKSRNLRQLIFYLKYFYMWKEVYK